MDYITKFAELEIESRDSDYPCNDIGASKLFSDVHREKICYVIEAKAWYVYDGRRWSKDSGGLAVTEMCKEFVQEYKYYLHEYRRFDVEYMEFIECK